VFAKIVLAAFLFEPGVCNFYYGFLDFIIGTTNNKIPKNGQYYLKILFLKTLYIQITTAV
jgi:hypothetical protein